MCPGALAGLLLLLGVASLSGTAAQTLDDAVSCDKNFTAPSASYTLNTTGPGQCSWQISRNTTGQTSIVFSEFLLGKEDYLVVYDGNGNESEVVNATGKKDSFLVVTFSKTISIEYTQASPGAVGLTFKYDTTDCLLDVGPQYAGRMSAPFYLPGQGSLTCQYHIVGLPQTQDKVMALGFTDFNIVSGVLNITDGDSYNYTNAGCIWTVAEAGRGVHHNQVSSRHSLSLRQTLMAVLVMLIAAT